MVPFAVTLRRTATAQVTVDYTTRDGNAQAASDYTAKSSTRRSRPASPARRSRSPSSTNSHDEGEETFTLALSNASGVAPGRRGDRDDREHRPDAGRAPSAVRQSDRRAGCPARRGAHGSASRRAIMILVTIKARGREYPHGHRAVTHPQGASLRCSCCAGDGVAGYSTSVSWRTLRTLTQFGALWAITWYTT